MTISELYKQEVGKFGKKNQFFLRQTYLNICDQEIERAKNGNLAVHTEENEEKCFECINNFIKSQDIEYWKEQKEIISKM